MIKNFTLRMVIFTKQRSSFVADPKASGCNGVFSEAKSVWINLFLVCIQREVKFALSHCL